MVSPLELAGDDVTDGSDLPEARFFIAVHAGAGFHSRSRSAQYRSAVAQACLAGAEQLRAGRGPRAAVVAAVRYLEAEPLSNAGLGSNLTLEGRVECDASIADSDGNFGAVGAVPGVTFPIEAADLLAAGSQQLLPLGRVPPLMLVGDAARRWALQRGLNCAADETEAEGWNVSPEAKARWELYCQMIRDAESAQSSEVEAGQGASPTQSSSLQDGACELCDTVGAVCVDGQGRTAAGVSSGGIAMKTPGRVGEAALIGAGCWAGTCVSSDSTTARGGGEDQPSGQDSPSCGPSSSSPGFACSVTGVGERIMKHCLAQRCAQQLSQCPSSAINEVCALAVRELAAEPSPNSAGMIAVKVVAAAPGEGSPADSASSSEAQEEESEEGGAGGQGPPGHLSGGLKQVHVEFAAVHSAASMALGCLSSKSMGAPTTTLLRQEEPSSGTSSARTLKRPREQTSLSMFGRSVVL